MDKKPKINSESRFLINFLKCTLLTPLILVQIIQGKKQFKDLFNPFKEIKNFLIEPKITVKIIQLNILFFIASLFIPESMFNLFVSYPTDILSSRFYTIITSGFLHASISHLFFNMLGIYIFGRVVERKLGQNKMILVYGSSLIISNIFNSLIHLFILQENIGGIGASGALMGVIATAMLIDPFYLTYELFFPLPIMVIGWLSILADIQGILRPANDGIGHFAHLGGFLSITIIMFLLEKHEIKHIKKGLIINIISLALFFVFNIFFI